VADIPDLRVKLERDEWILPEAKVVEEVDVKMLKDLCYNKIHDVFRHGASVTRGHTRIPLTCDDGKAPRPPRVNTKFVPVGILSRNVQKNSHLFSILTDFQNFIGDKDISLMLLDVGVFDHVVKVWFVVLSRCC